MRVGTVTNSVKVFETVNELFEAGKVSPLVQEVFPLEQAVEAHELSETFHGSGRIVLDVEGQR